MPMWGVTLTPPSAIVRPSGRVDCAPQCRSPKVAGVSWKLPFAGSHTRALSPVAHMRTFPVGCTIMCLPWKPQSSTAPHWPTWSGACALAVPIAARTSRAGSSPKPTQAVRRCRSLVSFASGTGESSESAAAAAGEACGVLGDPPRRVHGGRPVLCNLRAAGVPLTPTEVTPRAWTRPLRRGCVAQLLRRLRRGRNPASVGTDSVFRRRPARVSEEQPDAGRRGRGASGAPSSSRNGGMARVAGRGPCAPVGSPVAAPAQRRSRRLGSTRVDTAVTGLAHDPSDPNFGEDPYPYYRWLRDEQPVHRHAASGAYLLSRFRDVWGATNDWRTFSSRSRLPDPKHIAQMDPPQHDRPRSPAPPPLTPP